MSKIYQDKDWLYQNYVTEERPATEMAQMSGCHFSTIYYWLGKHEIPIRDQSESKVAAYKNPEMRRARAKSQAELWTDPEYRDARCKCARAQSFAPNSLRPFAVFGKTLHTAKTTASRCVPSAESRIPSQDACCYIGSLE